MENYVMNEIRKSYENNGLKFDGYYYRDNNQNEIDLVLVRDAHIHCIEIKKGSLFEKKHVKSFEQLKGSQYTMGLSCIICNTEHNYTINRDIFVYSVSCI